MQVSQMTTVGNDDAYQPFGAADSSFAVAGLDPALHPLRKPVNPFFEVDHRVFRCESKANAPPPVLLSGAGSAVVFFASPTRGGGAPTGAGAEAPHRLTRLAVGPISGSPEITGQ
jgi:hypothetical protein